MPILTAPSLLTDELSGAILTLKTLGVDDVAGFKYVHATPGAPALAGALERLHELKALSGTGTLTALGGTLAQLPFDAALGRAVLRAGRYGVHDEILAIACVVTEAPPGGTRALFHNIGARLQFAAEEGDHVTALNVYQGYVASGAGGNEWCRKHGVKAAVMRRAHTLFKSCVLRAAECDVSAVVGRDVAQRVCRALVDGLFAQAARRCDGEFGTHTSYSIMQGGRRAFVHPASVLHGSAAECVVYGECVKTGERYLRDVSIVRAEWLAEACDELYEIRNEI